jgi:hypothetical protein
VNRDLTQPPVGSQVTTSPTIPLTVEEYQRLIGMQAQLAQIQAEQKAALEEKEQAKLRAMAEKGQIEEAFAQSRKSWEEKVAEQAQKYNALESSLLAEKKLAVLSSAFAGRQFAGDTPEQQSIAAGQLRQLLESQFVAERDASGQIVVRDKVSLRPATDAVKEALASPLYAHFFAPTSRGGTGADASRPPAAQQQQTQPGSLEDIAAKFREAQQGVSRSFGVFGVAK